jgi:hypothetical protein
MQVASNKFLNTSIILESCHFPFMTIVVVYSVMGLVNAWRVSGVLIFRGTTKNLIIGVDQGLPTFTTWVGGGGVPSIDTCNLVTYESVMFCYQSVPPNLGTLSS